MLNTKYKFCLYNGIDIEKTLRESYKMRQSYKIHIKQENIKREEATKDVLRSGCTATVIIKGLTISGQSCGEGKLNPTLSKLKFGHVAVEPSSTFLIKLHPMHT